MAIAALAVSHAISEYATRPVLAQQIAFEAPVVFAGVSSSPLAVQPRQDWEIFGDAASSPQIPIGRASVRVPILMYHYIRINPVLRDTLGFNLSVTPDDFKAQMDLLDRRGYHPIDFNDLRGYLAGRNTLPSRPVVLTFDDGYRDLYTTAFPILKQHHFKAVSYVVTGLADSNAYITTPMIKEMDQNGIQIGAHTVHHADLTKVSHDTLIHEVVDSRKALEDIIGHPVIDFCYPSGQVNPAVVQVVSSAGFQTATTTQPGLVHSLGDRYLWTRVRVSGGESLDHYAAELGQEEAPVGMPGQQLAPVRTGAVPGFLPRLYPLLFPVTEPLTAPAPPRPAPSRRSPLTLER